MTQELAGPDGLISDKKDRVTEALTVYFGHSGSDENKDWKWLAIGYDGKGAVREKGTLRLFSTESTEKAKYRGKRIYFRYHYG